MIQNETSHNNLLDTTDCLEAVGVFKGWKNLLFIIIFICLLLTQACFWLVELGWVQIPAEAVLESRQDSRIMIPIVAGISENNIVQAEAAEQSRPTTETVLPSVSGIAAKNEGNTIVIGQQTSQGIKDFFRRLTFDRLVWILKLVNAILILTATIYCLTLLFSMKVSIIGRLGGINHITRAFFLSLLLLIFVLPWQLIFDSTVIGAIFTSGELIRGVSTKTDVMLEQILYYLRFTGYGVLIFLLLVLAQVRSCRWAGAILRRLEII
jgi:hypothetical protein